MLTRPQIGLGLPDKPEGVTGHEPRGGGSFDGGVQQGEGVPEPSRECVRGAKGGVDQRREDGKPGKALDGEPALQDSHRPIGPA